MARLVVLALVVVGVVVAYPWVGAVAGVGLVLLLVAVFCGRSRAEAPRRVGGGQVVARVSLDRRLAERAAWEEINRIERAHGVPPTPPGTVR